MGLQRIALRTSLSVKDCARVFGAVAHDGLPDHDDRGKRPSGPLDDDPPALGAAYASGLPVQMMVWDRGRYREVELLASCPEAEALLDRHVVAFRQCELDTEDALEPRPGALLPGNIVTMMTRFGRHEINRAARADERVAVVAATQDPLAVVAADDPAAFVAALAGTCLPAGDWAVYGAERTIVHLLGPRRRDAAWFELLDASIDFLRRNYVPLSRVPGYVLDRFVALGHRAEDWLVFRDPPDPHSVLITPLAEGEARCVIVGGAPDGHTAETRVLVRRHGHDFEAILAIDWGAGAGPDDAGICSEIPWKRASDLYDLYLDIAWSTPERGWAHPELEPFFPAPQALI